MTLIYSLLDLRLLHFIGAGCGDGDGLRVPYFHIEPKTLIRHLRRCGTKVLCEHLLVQKIVDCDRSMNGICTRRDGRPPHLGHVCGAPLHSNSDLLCY